MVRHIALVVAICLLPWAGRAAPPPAARARHADRNKDGVVTPREANKERQWEHQQKAIVSQPWEARADADHDGRVEPAEVRGYRLRVIDADHDGKITVAERRVYWVGWRAAVNTDVERKYDANHDGILEWVEAREMLRDRLRIIETDGRAIVNTDLEREFDDNGDGVIDRDEAAELKAALE